MRVSVWERVGRKSVACIHDDIYILYKQQQRRNICVCSHVRTPATDCIFRYVCEHTMLLGSNMCCYGNSHFLGGFDVSHVVTQVCGDFFFSFISEGHQTTSVLISLCFRFFFIFFVLRCEGGWARPFLKCALILSWHEDCALEPLFHYFMKKRLKCTWFREARGAFQSWDCCRNGTFFLVPAFVFVWVCTSPMCSRKNL